jgi:hypothetical protein
MTSFFNFKDDNMEIDDKIGISENKEIGSGAYKTVFSIKKDDSNRSFTVEKDFDINKHVIANITTEEWEDKEQELKNLKEELKIQLDLAAANRAVNVLQIKYNFKDLLEPCNINVNSSDDIDKKCDDMKDNIENLEKISVLMEKCNAQTIWSIQNIEQEFNELIDYLVDTKNMMLIDIKPDNLCIHNNKLIALDLDPLFIVQLDPYGAAWNEDKVAKACMFLIFVINLWIDLKNEDERTDIFKKKTSFIKSGLDHYFDTPITTSSMLEKINHDFGNNDDDYNVPYMIRHYYSSIDKNIVINKKDKALKEDITLEDALKEDITSAELEQILKQMSGFRRRKLKAKRTTTKGGIKGKNKKKTQKRKNKKKRKTQKKRP